MSRHNSQTLSAGTVLRQSRSLPVHAGRESRTRHYGAAKNADLGVEDAASVTFLTYRSEPAFRACGRSLRYCCFKRLWRRGWGSTGNAEYL